jgi:HD-GYP domain-containing protein (c-di-GMP phosphodiesterase class II)
MAPNPAAAQGAMSAPGAAAFASSVLTPPTPKAQRPCNPGRAPVAAPMGGRLKSAAKVCGSSFETVASLFENARVGRSLSFGDAQEAVDRLLENLDEDRDALLSMVRLKSHDDYACMHSVAVCVLMACLGRQMGFDEARVRQAAMAGLMHDIGKAFVSAGLLQKPDRFTAEEHRVVQAHTLFGHQALGQMEGIEEAVRDVALHHHERPDGKGYPDGLQGEQISVFARMGAICDVYDAVTSNRPYKDGCDPGFAMERMLKWTAAGQFDTRVMAAFQQVMGTYPIGSLVRLKSQRLAVINAQRSEKPLQPSVTAFYCTRVGELFPPEVIDLSLPGAQDAIESTESNGVWHFTDLDTLWAGDLAGGIHHAGYLPATLPGGIRC